MVEKVHKYFEILLLLIAANILNRNVQRSKFISRQDNNFLFEIPYELRAIVKRIKEDYKNE